MKETLTEIVVMTVRRRTLEVLLVRRPGNVWSLPGGDCDPTRTLQESALSALVEEAGIRGIWLEQLYTFDRDGGAGLAVAHLALIAADRHPPAPGPDVVEVRWFPVEDLPALSEDHLTTLEYAHRRLRAKTAYAPIAFQLLPELFTLGELQTVYEAVLGAPIDTRNFRRDVLAAGVVEDAGATRNSGRGRPARLYRSRPGDFAVDGRERRISERIGAAPPVPSTVSPLEDS